MFEETGSSARGTPFTYEGITTERAVEEIKLAMRCPRCNHMNHVPVKRLLLSDDASKEIQKSDINLYAPLDIAKCEKCGNVIAKPEKLIHLK